MTKTPPPFVGGPFEFGTRVRLIDGKHAGQTGTVVANIQDVLFDVALDGETEWPVTVRDLVPEQFETI